MSLIRTGVVLDYDKLIKMPQNNHIHKLRRIFSIETMGFNKTKKRICCMRITKYENKIKIILPRFGGFMLQDNKLIDKIDNFLDEGKPLLIPEFTIKVTNNQKLVLNYLMETVYTKDNIDSGRSSSIVQMDAGYGKTYIAAALINLVKKKTCVIVPNEYLLKQWVCILESAFPKNTVGVYYGKKKRDGDIIVSIVNSAIKYENYDDIGLVIYDEVHMYCSNKISKIFNMAQSRLCLGITATPNQRLDKFDLVAQWALGKVIYSNKIKNWDPLAVEFKSIVTKVVFNGHPDHTKILESAAGIVSVPLMINQLQEDPHRNKIIIEYAIKLYKMGRNIFIFSDRREHLHVLAKTLQELKIDYEAPELKDCKKMKGVTELMGGSTELDIGYAKTEGRIIMTTFQYSGTGVSINKMNSLILATPRKSNMTQILGRIFRLSSDSSITRHIIDIVDNRVCLKSQYYGRKKIYNKLNADINIVKINWDSQLKL